MTWKANWTRFWRKFRLRRFRIVIKSENKAKALLWRSKKWRKRNFNRKGIKGTRWSNVKRNPNKTIKPISIWKKRSSSKEQKAKCPYFPTRKLKNRSKSKNLLEFKRKSWRETKKFWKSFQILSWNWVEFITFNQLLLAGSFETAEPMFPKLFICQKMGRNLCWNKPTQIYLKMLKIELVETSMIMLML